MQKVHPPPLVKNSENVGQLSIPRLSPLANTYSMNDLNVVIVVFYVYLLLEALMRRYREISLSIKAWKVEVTVHGTR